MSAERSGPRINGSRHEIAAAKPLSQRQGTTGRGQSTEFETGYRLGFETGVDVGYQRCQYEQTRDYLQDIEDQPELAATRGPSLSELRRIRAELPEDRVNCGCRVRCARCDWVDRHGGDHPGGPVVWSVAS